LTSYSTSAAKRTGGESSLASARDRLLVSRDTLKKPIRKQGWAVICTGGETQERYDLFMNNFTERTWTMVTISEAIKNKMKTYVQYPPRKLQSEVYTGPITLSEYQRFKFVRDQLASEGISIPLPTGN
jgi:hypothetical protein